MRVALIGGTGLVGAALTDLLLADPGIELHSILRRPSGRRSESLHEHVASPERWPELALDVKADAAVSALGTTMRAAGSEAAFRAVDLDMVVAFARAARTSGARHMATVSSVGADAGSRNFYLRIKGEMEQALEALAFDRLDIFQPGLLLGKRGGERRTGERIAIRLSPITNLFLRGAFGRYAAIEGKAVAAAIAASLRQSGGGVHRHQNREIRELAAHQA